MKKELSKQIKEKYVCLRCGRTGLKKIGKCPYCGGIIIKKTVLSNSEVC